MNRPDSNSSDPSANQDDAVWLDLVARLQADDTPVPDADAVPGDGDTPAPGSSRHHGGPRHSTATSDDAADDAGSARAEQPEAGSGQGEVPVGAGDPRDYSVEDDDDGFVPEEPPKLSATDPLTMLAWLGAVGAPVALVLSSMFWRSAPLLAILGMVAVFIGSVVYLIMKLPQEKDENDDGARV